MPSLLSSFFLFPQFFTIPTEILKIRLHYQNKVFVRKFGLSHENINKTELSELGFIKLYLKYRFEDISNSFYSLNYDFVEIYLLNLCIEKHPSR